MTYLNEDTLVQQTTTDYLKDKLGWDSVYAYNQETFGPGGLLGRNSDREVVLPRYLKQALKKFNPHLPETAYDEAVRQVVDYSQSQSMLSSNFDKYKLFKDGVLVSFQEEHGEIKKERLKIFENFIIYDDSTGKQRKVLNDINERIAEKLEEIEINDIDVSQRLQKELKRDYHIITAEKRPQEIQKIKKVAKELLETLKEKLKNLYKWQDREPTRDEVKVLIRNFLWDDATGLPTEYYTQNDVNRKTEAVFYHVYRAYPTVPSPYYASVGN